MVYNAPQCRFNVDTNLVAHADGLVVVSEGSNEQALMDNVQTFKLEDLELRLQDTVNYLEVMLEETSEATKTATP